MTDMSAQDLASRLVIDNAAIIRASYIVNDTYDPFNNGVASLVEDAVRAAYDFSAREARAFVRTLVKEL